MTVSTVIAVLVSLFFLLLTLSICVLLCVFARRARLTETDLEPAPVSKSKTNKKESLS